jgi:hypothetical protein
MNSIWAGPHPKKFWKPLCERPSSDAAVEPRPKPGLQPREQSGITTSVANPKDVRNKMRCRRPSS